jgi:hypothetical protein
MGAGEATPSNQTLSLADSMELFSYLFAGVFWFFVLNSLKFSKRR